MNQQSRLKTQDSISLPRARRNPRLALSALFFIAFVAAVFLTVVGTLFSLSGQAEQTAQAYPILVFNLILILILGSYLGYRVWSILFSQKSRQSAPVLHRRFVVIFSLAALTPAIVVGAFSTSLISRNINDLFGENVRSNMEQARAFLSDYVEQQSIELRRDIRIVENELNRRAGVVGARISYTADLQILSRVRDLDAVFILQKDGYVLTRVESANAPAFEIPMPAVFENLKDNDIAIQKRDDVDYLIGVSRLQAYDNAYLYVGQLLKSDSPVLSSISGIEKTTQAIDQFTADQSLMGRIFLLTFIETALLILLAAIWLGLALANRIIDPLGRLINAAERVRSGDMTAHVDVRGNWGEISDLGSAFNRMTRQLNSQRDELVREHDISEQRRQFSEAVLSGVRAGVIGLTQQGRITLMNESASRLLGSRDKTMLGYPIEDVLGEFAPAFSKARESIMGTAEDQVNFETDDGIRNFDLRVSAYQGVRKDTGWVVTFDDMTRLVAAQRHSAWREVARRIAHEIKNPLTPIQLSAERLLRKYSGEIKTDPDIFENCTQTIIRQVASLEQMVDEFSAFARMPAPSFEITDIRGLLEDVLFAQGVAFPEIKFELEDMTQGHLNALCDERLITQALTNIYKNAGESVTRCNDEAGNDEAGGVIHTSVAVEDEQILLHISDNGMGWPFPDRERVLEPYVTTRETGTGLGLAIVMRIIDDHGGRLSLKDRIDGKQGAMIVISLPKGECSRQPEITQSTLSENTHEI